MTFHVDAENRQIIETVIGSLRLEGLTVEPQVLQDMELISLGKISTDDAIKAAFARVVNEQKI